LIIFSNEAQSERATHWRSRLKARSSTNYEGR
jgi:hypothetical protein